MQISDHDNERLERAPAALVRVSLAHMRLARKYRRVWILAYVLLGVIVLLLIIR